MKTRKAFKIIAAATLAAVVFAATGGTLVYFAVTAGAEFDENALPDSYTTSTVLAADNTIIKSSATMSGIQPDAIPRNLGAAFVAAEDKRFYNHRGIDYIRIAGAALKDIKKRSFAEGGSTISQQLIKNTHLSREKTLERKLKELKLATKLEKKFDKNEILAMYLNVLYFGRGIYGVNQASEELLGKTPEELTVAECAMLAAIIKNPAGYSPVNHPEACKNRRNLILKLMLDQEYIGEKEYAAACASPLGIKTAQKDYAELYVNSVYAEAADKLGITPSAVKNGGYEIQTYYLQSRQKALYENLHDGNLYAPGDNATYGAAIMCDNASKGISAYYSIDNTLAGQMRRQGASVVKPLLVYAPSMETGAVSPATQIMDEPVDFGGYAFDDTHSRSGHNNFKGVSALFQPAYARDGLSVAIAHQAVCSVRRIGAESSCSVRYSVDEYFGFSARSAEHGFYAHAAPLERIFDGVADVFSRHTRRKRKFFVVNFLKAVASRRVGSGFFESQSGSVRRGSIKCLHGHRPHSVFDAAAV